MKVRFYFISLLLVTGNCIEPYQPPVIESPTTLLVVDGSIDVTNNKAVVQLSHTVPLSEANPIPVYEYNALVTIEDSEQHVVQLNEAADGVYSVTNLVINPDLKYRLRIKTLNKKEYVSEFIEIKVTPRIDNISWKPNSEGIEIFVNSHDPLSQSRYYRWSFTETYEYTSNYYSSYQHINGVVSFRPPAESIYTCWKTINSTEILISTSNRLYEDRISNFLLTTIPKDSEKISRRYHINVTQVTLSEQGYTYWSLLKKNTENLGTLFDPMPSQIYGNIKCLSDGNERVIGYFDAATVETYQIFISPQELPERYSTFRHPYCPLDTVLLENISSVNPNSLVAPVYRPETEIIIGYLVARLYCTDCRVSGGGTLTKPDFWD